MEHRGREIMERLAEPFPYEELKFKPQVVSKDGSKAMTITYIDARLVEDRLDEVVGADWQDEYEVLSNGSVVCRLSIFVGDRWITRADVGAPSEQPDKHDQLKACFSDAFKRAAVKWGIGRYLYALPKSWCKYDSGRKILLATPTLPAWALPRQQSSAPAPKADSPIVSPQLVAEFLRLCGDAGISEADARMRCRQKYGGRELEQITVAEISAASNSVQKQKAS